MLIIVRFENNDFSYSSSNISSNHNNSSSSDEINMEEQIFVHEKRG